MSQETARLIKNNIRAYAKKEGIDNYLDLPVYMADGLRPAFALTKNGVIYRLGEYIKDVASGEAKIQSFKRAILSVDNGSVYIMVVRSDIEPAWNRITSMMYKG